MNLRKLVCLIFLSIFIFPSISFSLELSSYLSVDELTKSIQNEPEQWLINSSRAIFFGDSKLVKRAKKRSFPETSDTAKIVIYFNLYSGSAQLEKPEGGWYKGSDLKKIIRTIKLYKYNRYKKELGIEDKTKIIIKEIEKKEDKIRKLY